MDIFKIKSNQIIIFQCDFKNLKIVPKSCKIRFCKIANETVQYPACPLLLDPCTSLSSSACGECAKCQTINHILQCTCPANSVGDPYQSCKKNYLRCSNVSQSCPKGSTCSSGFCVPTCHSSTDCACGEQCSTDGKCLQTCRANDNCQNGVQCVSGTCVAGCRSNNDCSANQACYNGQCVDPCSVSDCGAHSECSISYHDAVCLCRSGYQRNGALGCRKAECTINADCNRDKGCDQGSCVNPCSNAQNPCGNNAECRVVNHVAKCVCPPRYYGNPDTGCQADRDECADKPCGDNAICIDRLGGHDCKCNPGCTGEPFSGCSCPTRVNACRRKRCGTNARCRQDSQGSATCFCPQTHPNGNPNKQCTIGKWHDNL
jgi:hypothetical protein